MAKKEGLGSVKRFGVRYGTTTKFKTAQVEKLYYGKRLKCPYCSKNRVKRVFFGVWECRKCDAKFTAKAYTIEKEAVATEEA
ncbi:MAG: 50S ribosomal protein L37ae [Candidatus Aenigmarchaeota archaeon]|nr:50S ribosomal protein L37ae [Candidatus Aenigmarchaeota archaeon]